MSDLFEQLGLTKKKAQALVVERAVGELLDRENDDGYNATLDDLVLKSCEAIIKAKVERIADEELTPRLTAMIEEIQLQRTNDWGESKGDPVSFVEYLVERVEVYLTETVSHDGKAKKQGDRHSWKGKGTRVEMAIDRHLQYSVQVALDTIMKNATNHFTQGLEVAFKVKLEELTKGITFHTKGIGR